MARELTKLHETVVHGTLGDVDIGEPRGEYVLVVAGAPAAVEVPGDDAVRAALRIELAAGRSRRDAASVVAARLGVPRRVAYDLAVAEPAGAGGVPYTAARSQRPRDDERAGDPHNA